MAISGAITATSLSEALCCGRAGCRCQRPRAHVTHCPSHQPDRTPSLDVVDRNGKLLVICRAGCRQQAVVEALRTRGLWGHARSSGPTARPLTTYQLAMREAQGEPWYDELQR